MAPYVYDRLAAMALPSGEAWMVRKTIIYLYVTLKACFMAIKRKIDKSDNLDEKITFGITDSEKVPANWIYKKKYKIDEFYFHNLCKQTENRNQKFLELSKQIMPEI